jgi:hypothetical protein
MADDTTEESRTGRLLLFEPDPLKRHYFHKYVLGILWRGLSDAGKQQRLASVVQQRREEFATSRKE